MNIVWPCSSCCLHFLCCVSIQSFFSLIFDLESFRTTEAGFWLYFLGLFHFYMLPTHGPPLKIVEGVSPPLTKVQKKIIKGVWGGS